MNYELGLEMLNKLAENTSWYQEFTNFESQLRENLREERRYGSDERSRRDRARIVDQLNGLCLKHISTSFNDLCLGKTSYSSGNKKNAGAPSAVIMVNTGGGTYIAGNVEVGNNFVGRDMSTMPNKSENESAKTKSL